MMTMPVLPSLTYSEAEAVHQSHLLLHLGVPTFRATFCLEIYSLSSSNATLCLVQSMKG